LSTSLGIRTVAPYAWRPPSVTGPRSQA
jgi:hypothetical protein